MVSEGVAYLYENVGLATAQHSEGVAYLYENAVEAEPCVPPPNDNWADAEVLTGTGGVVNGSVVCASIEIGEDDRYENISIWYSYTPPNNGLLTLDTSGSNVDTLMGIYVDGITLSNLVTEDDDGGVGSTSLILDFPVTAGTIYRIRIDSFGSLDPGEGDVVLTWSASLEEPCSPPLNDNWANAEVLVGDSGAVTGTTVCATLEPEEPSVSCSSPPSCPDDTVWYAYTPSSSGVTTFFIDPEGLMVHMEVFTGSALGSLVGPVASYEGADPLAPTAVPVTGWTTYWIRVYNDVPGESGPFTLSWDLVPTLTPLKAKQGTGRLGCGELSAFITSQCGAPRLCQLTDASHISWNRKLDEISEASVVVPTGGSNESECCECLAEIEPWCHELHIFRNGVFVWGGPVTKVTYGYDEVTVNAKDVLAWTQFRVPELTLDYSVTGADIADIAETILLVAFAEHDPCVVEFIQKRATEFPNINLNPLPCFEQSAYEQLTDLADGLLDFTVLGRSIVLGGENLPTKAIGVLTDEMILGEIEVTKDGLLAGNRYFTRFEGDDVAAQCAPEVDITCPGCPCKCPAISEGDQECYGPLEHVLDIGQPANHDTAKQFGDAHLAATRIVPRTIEFPDGTRVSPEAPWDINDMVPGQRIDVALTGLCLPVYQSFRLVEMTSSQDGLGEEEVTVSLELVVPAS